MCVVALGSESEKRKEERREQKVIPKRSTTKRTPLSF